MIYLKFSTINKCIFSEYIIFFLIEVEDAIAALEMLNGTIYKGKPIIIQFSNNTYMEKTSNNGNV